MVGVARSHQQRSNDHETHLLGGRRRDGHRNIPFPTRGGRVPDLFAGIYSLRAGSDDGQSPHDQDELYYILEGSGTIEVEGESRKVGAGAVIYVRKQAAHAFVDITHDLRVLVFFANGGDG